MAIFYRCDRCRREKKKLIEKVAIPTFENNSDYRVDRHVDLCNDCVIQLNKFINTIPDYKE